MKKRNIECGIKAVVLVVLALACSLWASQAQALPASYQFSGSGYGDLNGDPVFNAVNYNINLATLATTTVDTTSFANVTYVLGLKGSAVLGPDAFPELANTVPYNGYSGNFLDNLYLSFDSISNSLEFGSFDLSQGTPGVDPFGALAFWRFNIGSPLNILATSGPTLYFVDPITGLPPVGGMPVPEFGAFMNTNVITNPDGSFFSSDVLTLGADTMSFTAAVPEPSTFILIASGLLGVGIWRRRKV